MSSAGNDDTIVLIYSIGVSFVITGVMGLFFYYFSGGNNQNQSALFVLVSSIFTGSKLPERSDATPAGTAGTAGTGTAASDKDNGKTRRNNADVNGIGSKALAFHQAGKYDEAVNIYKEVRANEPHNVKVLYRYALLLSSYYQDGAQAEEIIKEILLVDPNYADVLGLYAVIRENQGDFVLAQEMHSRAYLADPNSVPRLRNYASLLDHLGRHAEARVLYEEALSTSPQNMDIQYDYAYNLECCHLFAEAEEVYKRILRSNPGHSDAGNNYAGLLYMKCKKTKNMADLDEAIRLLGSSKTKCKVSSLNLSGCKMLKLQLCGCAKCGKACTEFCASCKLVRYCSKACQTADWKAHKKHCQGKGGAPRAQEDTTDNDGSHTGFWGCTDCGGACTCGPAHSGGPHSESCSHSKYTAALKQKAKSKGKSGSICPGEAECVWLHCCESADRKSVCSLGDGAVDPAIVPVCRLFKYTRTTSTKPAVSFAQ